MENKIYCYHCGAQTKIVERIYAYDEYTGYPKIVEDAYCPNKKWYHYIWESHPVTRAESYCQQGQYGK